MDTDNWIVTASTTVRVPNIAPQVYADDAFVDPFDSDGDPIYFFNPGVDYEGTGHIIAGVIFFTDPTAYRITWRGWARHRGMGGH